MPGTHMTVGALVEILKQFPQELDLAIEVDGRYLTSLSVEPEDGLDGVCIVASDSKSSDLWQGAAPNERLYGPHPPTG